MEKTLAAALTNADPAARWVSIRRASEILGVSQATLRQWSDHGKVRTFITPGGHRRFAESELFGLLEQHQSTAVPSLSELLLASHERYEQVVRRCLTENGWFSSFDDEARRTFRILGNSLLQLLTGYVVSGRKERDRCLEQGREVAQRYGTQAAELGLSLAQATDAFLLFRNPVLECVNRWLRDQPGPRRGTEEIPRRVNSFMDQLLLSMAAAHEGYRALRRPGKGS